MIVKVAGFGDYVKFLPNVSYQSAGPGFSRPYMRGVASGENANHSGPLPSVGVYLDEQPIGNGPFMMDGPWQHNVGIKLKRFDGYNIGHPAYLDSVEITITANGVDDAGNQLDSAGQHDGGISEGRRAIRNRDGEVFKETHEIAQDSLLPSCSDREAVASHLPSGSNVTAQIAC